MEEGGREEGGKGGREGGRQASINVLVFYEYHVIRVNEKAYILLLCDLKETHV